MRFRRIKKGKIVNDDKNQKQFAYLFLDMEWNRNPEIAEMEEYEVFQMSAIGVDADIQKIKSFSKIIRLHNSKNTSHAPAENMIQGVLRSFVQTFPEYQYIVVWDRNTYNLFKRSMKKYGACIKRQQVIVFQEIFNKIVGNENGLIGFKEALEHVGIDYFPNSLACSKCNVDYLYQLFCKCYHQYREVLTENNIDKICKRLQLSYSISNDIVFIRTSFSRWIVYLRDGKVSKLYHENYRHGKSQYCKRQKLKCVEGYHKQELPSENLYEVIHYIKIHDTGAVKRLAKKSRIEKLLEMVEMERKLKNTEEKDYGNDNMPELRRKNIG